MSVRRTLRLLATALLAAACTPTLVEFEPRVHVVQSGETLFSIAWRYELDVRELVLWNELDNPDLILVGQRLFLTAGQSAESRAANAGQPPLVSPASSGSTGSARAETGQPEIARAETGQPVMASSSATADSDDASAGNSANGGQTATQVAEPVASTSVSTPGAAASTSVPTPVRIPAPMPAPLPAPARTAAGSMSAAPAGPEPTAASRPPPPPSSSLAVLPAPTWQWPIRGPVVSPYGAAQGTGSGVGIGGRLGADIRASATGQVVYAGDGLAAYGNLIIIKHNDTFLSAYGHNDALIVGEGDAVQQGDVIARMGMGPERQPRVHFEIRRNGTPVDPLGYLPN